jgi:GNAT superfamily N-acetyltransferase
VAGPEWHDRSMISCRPVPVDAADSVALLRAYYTEIVDRYHGRPTPSDVLDAALAADPSDDLTLFLIAYDGIAAVGCGGMRPLTPHIAEVKRMYVRPADRGRGVGRLLLDEAEQRARALGVTALRLDTRSDLVEARGLYTRHGFVEIPRYNDAPFADHWYEKLLG